MAAGAIFRQRQQQWQSAASAPKLECFAQELYDHVMALERDLLGEELSRYDVSAEEVNLNGAVHHKCLKSSETYLTAAGPVSVMRHLYRPTGRGSKSICPLELRAGIVDGLWTPRAARQGAFVMAHLMPL